MAAVKVATLVAMPAPGRIARRAAADARTAEVLSVREQRGNRGVWVDAYNRTAGAELGSPWCASFVYTRLLKAAQALGRALPADFTPRAYTPTWRTWAVGRGLWTPVATAQASPARVQAGDLVCFYFRSMGRIAHIGIVVEVHPWGVVTVEGNTGPDAGDEVERNGSGVWEKRRKWSQLGARGGFVRLAF